MLLSPSQNRKLLGRFVPDNVTELALSTISSAFSTYPYDRRRALSFIAIHETIRLSRLNPSSDITERISHWKKLSRDIDSGQFEDFYLMNRVLDINLSRDNSMYRTCYGILNGCLVSETIRLEDPLIAMTSAYYQTLNELSIITQTIPVNTKQHQIYTHAVSTSEEVFNKMRKQIVSLTLSSPLIQVRSGEALDGDNVHIIIDFLNSIGANKWHLDVVPKMIARESPLNTETGSIFCRRFMGDFRRDNESNKKGNIFKTMRFLIMMTWSYIYYHNPEADIHRTLLVMKKYTDFFCQLFSLDRVDNNLIKIAKALENT